MERPAARRGRQHGEAHGTERPAAGEASRLGPGESAEQEASARPGPARTRQQPHPPQTNKSQRKGGEGRRKDENRLGGPGWKTQLLKNVAEPAGRVSNDVW